MQANQARTSNMTKKSEWHLIDVHSD